MIQQTTKGIKISVDTNFEGVLYKNHRKYFAFKYEICIENQSEDKVQLLSRHWYISDALNYPETVDGEGVVGEKPVIYTGRKHKYSSGCFLFSPFGAMKGYYNMVNLNNGKRFRVTIPSFKLNATFLLN